MNLIFYMLFLLEYAVYLERKKNSSLVRLIELFISRVRNTNCVQPFQVIIPIVITNDHTSKPPKCSKSQSYFSYSHVMIVPRITAEL